MEFLKSCFSINLNEYENIGIDLEINKVLTIAFSAFIVGIILYNSYRRNINLTLSQLIRHGARNKESAKTLKELRLDKVASVRRMLCGDNLLTKLVTRAEDGKSNTSDSDPLSAKFYIKEEKYLLAESISTRRDASVTSTVMACIFIAIVCVCIIACMPSILNVINNLLQ